MPIFELVHLWTISGTGSHVACISDSCHFSIFDMSGMAMTGRFLAIRFRAPKTEKLAMAKTAIEVRSDRHSGAAILLWEREGKALGVPKPSNERRRSASLSRNAAQATAPLHGATQTDGVRALLCVSAHPARREARAPAGQLKEAAPSRSAAGKSAT